jgi:PAS domain S-box-containing protein
VLRWTPQCIFFLFLIEFLIFVARGGRAVRKSTHKHPEVGAVSAESNPAPHLPNAFHETGKMVEALLESASQAILSVDSTGKIVLANRRAEEMFNYTREELLGASIEMLLPESKRGIHERHRQQYFGQPRVRPMGIGMELSGWKRCGIEFPVEVSLSAIHTPDGVFAMLS